MGSRALFRQTKLFFYEVLIPAVLVYGAESWVLSWSDVAAFEMFKGKSAQNFQHHTY